MHVFIHEPYSNHKPETYDESPTKKKGKESKYNAKNSHQIIREESKEKKWKSVKTTRKQDTK